jgi:hypothetical protein
LNQKFLGTCTPMADEQENLRIRNNVTSPIH